MCMFLYAFVCFVFSKLLQRDAMHSVDYAVARCPSVCPSHAGILSKRLTTLSNFFHHSSFPQILRRGPPNGASSSRVV